MNSQASQCLVLDSSAIIVLAETVYEEVVVKGRGRPGSEELRDLIRRGKVGVLKPRNRALVEALHDPLGMGESEAIALAVERDCTVVLDDRIARLKARSMGIAVKGTIGLLGLAYGKGLIDKGELIQALRGLKEHGFRVSDRVVNEILKKLK